MMIDEPEGSPTGILSNEAEVLRSTGVSILKGFLDQHKLYDLMRDSGKVVVFDTSIPIQLAFYALLEHGARVAPLWDSSTRKFIGLLTVTDFIDILRHFHKKGTPMDVLSTRTIAEVVNDPEGRKLQHDVFVSASADCSISSAIELLKSHSIRFLPVVSDDNRVLTIVSYHDILRFIVNNFKEHRKLFETPLLDLKVAATTVTTTEDKETLGSVLDTMEKHDISSIPVVNSEGQLVAVYARADIRFITAAADAQGVISNLDLPLKAILQMEQHGILLEKEDYITCPPESTLQSVIERFPTSNFHRVIFLNEDAECMALVSVRDLVVYLQGES